MFNFYPKDKFKNQTNIKKNTKKETSLMIMSKQGALIWAATKKDSSRTIYSFEPILCVRSNWIKWYFYIQYLCFDPSKLMLVN